METTLPLFVYFIILLAFALKPGPGVLFFVSLAVAEGPKAALIAGLGTDIGHFLIFLLLLTGFNIIELHPNIVLVVQVCASLYIGYAGLLILLKAKQQRAGERSPGLKNNARRVLKGISWAATNPANALFYAALAPTLALGRDGLPVSHALSIAFLTGFTFFLARLPYVYFAGKAQGYLAEPATQQKFNQISGFIFVSISVAFLLFLMPKFGLFSPQ